MVSWHQNRCLDPEVWESFLRHQLDPALMPAPSELQFSPSANRPFKQIQIDDTVSTITKLNMCCFICLVIFDHDPFSNEDLPNII